MKRTIINLLAGVLGGLVSSLAVILIMNKNTLTVTDDSQNLPGTYVSNNLPGTAPDFTFAAGKSVNAVVHVKTKYSYEVSSDPIYDFFFGTQPQKQQYQTPLMPVGSGIIISSDGYIVTNHHVVEKSEYIEVVLNDQRTYTARIIGNDASTDIAVLKIDETGLPFLTCGNSDALQIGEWVLAIGNPFNLTSTVTAGIVSAKARNINILSPYSIESFILTDAAVNPGNSGGALVNTSGELVGMNTAIASQTGSYVGYSFAVPSSIIKKIVSDIIEFGEVQRAYLGLNINGLDQQLAAQKGINEIQGVYVESVNSGGAGDEAGIKQGDVIVSVNDFKVLNVPQLHEQISKFRPGDKISVGLMRNGEGMTVTVELKNRNNGTSVIKTQNVTIMGASFEEVSAEERRTLNLKSGVKIKDPGTSKLYSLGIRQGFIITHINKKPVLTLDDAVLMLDKATGTLMIEGMYPNGIYAYYSFQK
jgi:Do/DeqQ family serine protease